jgi:cold-inducible RNA-binding protein
MSKIFVGNLPWSIKNSSLKDLFTSFGNVTDSVVVIDKNTGRSRGFGFVSFKEQNAANDSLVLNQHLVENRSIRVSLALDKPPKNNTHNTHNTHNTYNIHNTH